MPSNHGANVMHNKENSDQAKMLKSSLCLSRYSPPKRHIRPLELLRGHVGELPGRQASFTEAAT